MIAAAHSSLGDSFHCFAQLSFYFNKLCNDLPDGTLHEISKIVEMKSFHIPWAPQLSENQLLVECFGCWNLLSVAGMQSAVNCLIIESQRADLLPGQQKPRSLKHPDFSTTDDTQTSACFLAHFRKTPSGRDPSRHSSSPSLLQYNSSVSATDHVSNYPQSIESVRMMLWKQPHRQVARLRRSNCTDNNICLWKLDHVSCQQSVS